MVKIYAIKDLDLGNFTAVFTMPNDAVAIRGFSEECNNEKSDFHKYPEKIELWKLGAYDELGLHNGEKSECLFKASQCLVQKI